MKKIIILMSFLACSIAGFAQKRTANVLDSRDTLDVVIITIKYNKQKEPYLHLEDGKGIYSYCHYYVGTQSYRDNYVDLVNSKGDTIKKYLLIVPKNKID